MRKSLAALLFAPIVLAAACSSSPAPDSDGGDTEPGTPAVMPYPARLSAEAAEAKAYRDQIRLLDPCGYLDPQVIAGYGTPRFLGADGEFTKCVAQFSPPVGPKAVTAVKVSLIGPPEPGYGTPHTVDGTVIRTSKSPDFCTAYLPLNPRQDLSFVVETKGDLADRGPRIDLCPDALDVATAAIAHLGDRPLRSQSSYTGMNSKLARLDPCQILERLAADQPALWVTTLPNPWNCTYTFAPSDSTATAHVDYLWGNDSMLTGGNTSRIEGLPANAEKGSSRYPESCQMYVGTDPHWQPERGIGIRPKKVELIRISVETGTCARADTIARELVRLYQALPA